MRYGKLNLNYMGGIINGINIRHGEVRERNRE